MVMVVVVVVVVLMISLLSAGCRGEQADHR
jgi:hypothetical protein